jgi:hypothetical protein
MNPPTRVLALCLALAAGLGVPVAGGARPAHQDAQAGRPASSKVWIGHTTEIEAALREAPVSRIEDIGTGVTRPRRAWLTTPEASFDSFTWKVLPPGRRYGHWESYLSEIAAYELDKMLGMNLVPPVVEREIHGERGAAVMWVKGVVTLKGFGHPLTSNDVPARDIRRMVTFDALIANPDRNSGNILITDAHELVLIDHSRAFIDDRKPAAVERVDAEQWARIVALTPDGLHEHLDRLVGRRAVNALVARRDRLKADVDKLIAQRGREAVVF